MLISRWLRANNVGLLSFILAGLLALFLRDAGSLWAANQWSLDFAQNPATVALVVPPPTHPRAPSWLAEYALAQNDLETASLWLPVLQELAEKDNLAARMLAQVLWVQGDAKEAIENWIQVGDYNLLLEKANEAAISNRLDVAEHAYYGAWLVDPKEGTLALANFLWEQDEDESAKAILREAIAFAPDSNLVPSWFSQLGDFSRLQARWNEAEDIYQQLLLVAPENYNSYIGLGWVYYYRDGDFDKAMSAFQHAITIAPSKGDAYYAIGELYVLENSFSKADNWFSEAIKRSPSVLWWYFTRAQNAASYGNTSLSLLIYREIIDRFPANSQVYYEMAKIYKETEKPDDALVAIEIALQKMPSLNKTYLTTAREIYSWTGNIERGISTFERIIYRFPEEPSIYYELSYLYRLNAQVNDAIWAIETGITLLNEPKAWYYIQAAWIYEWANKPEQALSSYCKGLDLGADLDYIFDGIERLGGNCQ